MVGPVCEAHPYYPVCFVPVGVLVKDTPFQIQHSLISNFLFPTRWFCGRKVVFEIELPDMKPVSSFSILYLPMLSTNSLPHYNSYKSAWGGICQHCCSGTVYLNSHSLSGALVKNSVLFSSYWGCHKWDLTIYSLLFCYLLLIFFQLLWTQLLASLHLLKQSWKKFLTWELL